jgi:hypothetical protein
MTYSVKRQLGYAPWGVTNPWVYANLAQPQRRRVPSNYIWQTHAPRYGVHPLGGLGQAIASLFPDEARAKRMEFYSLLGLAATGFILLRPVMSARR